MSPQPFPFQADAVKTALAAPGQRWLFADEMGCGKTPQAILTAKEMNADRVLICTPAMVRRSWWQHFQSWWPERHEGGEGLAVLDMSPARKTQSKKRRASWEEVLSRPVRIVSPQLLHAAREREFLDGGRRPMVVLDEAHMLADPGSQQSLKARRLLKDFRGAVLGATATPIPNRPIGCWNLFDMIWPQRFGVGQKGKQAYSFAFRYVERIVGEYGSVPGGLHPVHGEELRRRLSYMMSRTTRAQIAHLLPPCSIRPYTVTPGTPPLAAVREWLEAALLEGSHVAILTHKRAAAKDLAVALNSAMLNRPVVHIDGGVPTPERGRRLDWLREQPGGILVSTLHAVNRGISLSWCTRAVLAELYWSPEQLEQLLGRFGRLDGVEPGVVDVFCGATTVQERMAFAVTAKLFDQAALMAESSTAAGLRQALEGDEEDLQRAVQDAAWSVATDAEREALSAITFGE